MENRNEIPGTTEKPVEEINAAPAPLEYNRATAEKDELLYQHAIRWCIYLSVGSAVMMVLQYLHIIKLETKTVWLMGVGVFFYLLVAWGYAADMRDRHAD